MALEIEHKYLVISDIYKEMATSHRHIRQGYLSRVPERTVRVRISDRQAWLTVKGLTDRDTRLEFEYPVPVADAEAMLGICEPGVIDKTRWIVPYGGHLWEVDEFGGEQAGLTLAEIELPEPDTSYALPPFVGENVTGDPRFYNSTLSRGRRAW